MGNTGWLEGCQIVQCRYFMWIRMVACERDGDGLHWLWDSGRGEPGTVQGNGTLDDFTLYFIRNIYEWTRSIVGFFLLCYVVSHSLSVCRLCVLVCLCVHIRAGLAKRNRRPTSGKHSPHGYRHVTVVSECGEMQIVNVVEVKRHHSAIRRWQTPVATLCWMKRQQAQRKNAMPRWKLSCRQCVHGTRN